MSVVSVRRRNLEAELPRQFLDYLRFNKFATISKFRKEFHVTNPNRAKALVHKMIGQGLIVPGNDPRPGKKGIVFMLEQNPKPRSKSKKYYDLQAGILEFLKARPEGARSFEIPDHLGVARNDATMIKGLKELVSEGQVTRTELGGRGRAVQYTFGSQTPQKAAKPSPAATELITEEGPVIEYLLQKYEAALNRIEELQRQVSQPATKLSAKPLPANLQARLKQLQAKDKMLTK